MVPSLRDPHEGGRPEKPLHDVIVSRPTLAELGITPIQSPGPLPSHLFHLQRSGPYVLHGGLALDVLAEYPDKYVQTMCLE